MVEAFFIFAYKWFTNLKAYKIIFYFQYKSFYTFFIFITKRFLKAFIIKE